MPDIVLTEKDDIYTVTEGARWSDVKALAGNDTITLLSGSNVLGGPGNDTIIDKTGGNFCAALYWDAPSAIDVNLQTGVAKDGWGSTDKLIDIHNVHTSGRDGDRVIGSDKDDNTWVNGFWMSGKAYIDLAAGYDAVTVSGKKTDFQIQASSDGRLVTLTRNKYTAFLYNIEGLQFWDNGSSSNQTLSIADLIDFSKVGADTLIQSTANAWSSNGKGLLLTFSFMSSVPGYGGSDGGTGFLQPSSAYQSAVRSILARLSQETGLTFREVTDSVSDFGQLRFGANQQASTKGYSFSAEATNGQRAGDVWMDVDSVAVLSEGSEGWQALLHEIGHALGLSHPVSESNTSGKTVLLDRWNSNAYSVMSERASTNNLWQSWFGPLDLQALRYLYGSGSGDSHPGNDSYKFTNSIGRFDSTISDASGYDTLDLSQISQGAYVDLTPGTFSSIGISPTGGTSINKIYIDSSSLIEELIGTAYDDVLIGNSTNNVFYPGLGNNFVDGAGGFNVVKMNSNRADFSLFKDSATGHVWLQASDGASGANEIQNIDRISFKDCAIALDMDSKGSTVARILGAVFGKTYITNREYAGVGMGLMDQNLSTVSLMDLALRTKLGTGYSATSEVNLFFGNLIGRAPSDAELKFYTNLVGSGQYTLNSLGWLAANSDQNASNIGLSGLLQTGLEYTPIGHAIV